MNEWDHVARILPTYLATLRNWYGHPASLSGILTDTEPYHLASDIEAILADMCGFELRLGDLEGLDDVYVPDFRAAAAADEWESLPPWDCFLRENSVATTSVL